ncbi:MAG: ABC transporter ATP-binding protein [Gammaproteobacteria bacterium]|nr:ABC transporter ATP-binding protein [Gammaproteobacteria bacterium]
MTESSINKKPLLSIRELDVAFGIPPQELTTVVKNVSFDIHKGEKLALVGESGSGKSVTALSVLQLHDKRQTHYLNGEIYFNQDNLLNHSEDMMRQIRGQDIAMIFQEPMTALNPVYRIGEQLTETIIIHKGFSRKKAKDHMIELLDRTGIVEPHKRFDAFPHMLSGGQRQRVMIAMALACQPQLLIADEPTTALDVTIQAQILELLEDLQKEFGMAVGMITHDLNMVRRFADRVCVMQNGTIVEQKSVGDLFANAEHDYTHLLLNSQPETLVKVSDKAIIEKQSNLLEAKNIRCYFPIKEGFFNKKIGDVKAVDDVSLDIYSGENLAIVGESGSGKTTLGMCLLRLQDSQGKILLEDNDITSLSGRELRPLRRDIQVVFEDPFSSLSPRMTIKQIIEEGLKIHFPNLSEDQRYLRIIKVLHEVGLEESMLTRYPHEFSGGQRQRIAIARVVVLEPKLILLDEPTSALDVSVQKQVLTLLRELQEKHNISYLFITHDLRVIRAMAHKVIVMQHGKVVEAGDTEELFNKPQNEYTRTLLEASLFRD